ncbi:MAG: hypothetical protein KGZ96_14395 [Clostridia bacterium]|nr:hypothetical protein [Clostridia bacterium]
MFLSTGSPVNGSVFRLDLNGFEQDFHRWLRAIYPAGQVGKPDGANEKKPHAKKAHWTGQMS